VAFAPATYLRRNYVNYTPFQNIANSARAHEGQAAAAG